VGYGRVEWTVEETECEGTEDEGTPKGWFIPPYPKSFADLIGGAATQVFSPGGKHPRAATEVC